jgi:hypothetical protein
MKRCLSAGETGLVIPSSSAIKMGASNAAAESGQTMHFSAEIDGYLTEVVGKSARCCLGIVLGRRLMTDVEVHEGIQGDPDLRW